MQFKIWILFSLILIIYAVQTCKCVKFYKELTHYLLLLSFYEWSNIINKQGLTISKGIPFH